MTITRKMPVLAKQSKAEVANSSNSIEKHGICPTCGRNMERVHANNIPAWVCLEHRICLPIPKEHQLQNLF